VRHWIGLREPLNWTLWYTRCNLSRKQRTTVMRLMRFTFGTFSMRLSKHQWSWKVIVLLIFVSELALIFFSATQLTAMVMRLIRFRTCTTTNNYTMWLGEDRWSWNWFALNSYTFDMVEQTTMGVKFICSGLLPHLLIREWLAAMVMGMIRDRPDASYICLNK